MFFFIRKPKIILYCFTDSEKIKHNSPIQNAATLIPDWFKCMPSEYMESDFIPTSTIKKCPAFVKNATTGFIMPMWVDLALKVENGVYTWQSAHHAWGADIHKSDQWNHFKNPNEFGHLKLNSPWWFKTKEDISFVWQQPYLHKLNSNIEIVQGIDSYSNFHGTSVNCFLNLQSNYKMLIRQNTPLVHLIPLTEKKVIVKNIVVSEKEINKLRPNHLVFQGKSKKATCPF